MKYKINETIITASDSTKALKAYKIFRDSRFRDSIKDSKASDIANKIKSKFPGIQLQVKDVTKVVSTDVIISNYGNNNKKEVYNYLYNNFGNERNVYISENKVSVFDSIKDVDIDKYQEWVDYDMKHYGHISDKTNRLIKEAGLEIVKDIHGDYEVITHEDN